ncbi:MAG: hypothetical protein JJU11_07350, partial [Candidatus Sumerlaeia bacterium]|nr:hypothetical protein [Candidatus Sumerlaeia bacterium]
MRDEILFNTTSDFPTPNGEAREHFHLCVVNTPIDPFQPGAGTYSSGNAILRSGILAHLPQSTTGHLPGSQFGLDGGYTFPSDGGEAVNQYAAGPGEVSR